jgi:CheY-like chemotaxis protein
VEAGRRCPETAKEAIMSSEAQTILVVTDDPCFSGLVSELMLRAGVQTLRFAKTQDALQQTRDLSPDLVLIHMPRERLDVGRASYEMLRSDSTIACIPVLFYTPPAVLGQRAVGVPVGGSSADALAGSDMLMTQIISLSSADLSSWRRTEPAPGEEQFPTGRDDL